MRARLSTVSTLGMLLVVAMSPAIVRADHCNEATRALGPAESQLAGVDLQRGELRDAIRHLGTPTTTEVLPEADYPGSRFSWERAAERVTVWSVSIPLNGKGSTERVVAVQIEAASAEMAARDPRLATGRGVAIGDSRDVVLAKYGSAFVEEDVEGRSALFYCWRNDTYLSFEFNSSQLVTRIHLLRQEE